MNVCLEKVESEPEFPASEVCVSILNTLLAAQLTELIAEGVMLPPMLTNSYILHL